MTSKLWPSEFGEGVTAKAIDDMLERLQLDYLDCIYLHHPAGDYMGAWHDLEEAYMCGIMMFTAKSGITQNRFC